jgi:Uncharacterized conserved protein (DUF2304)
MSVQLAILIAGAGSLTVSTVVLVRRRLLSIRYGMGWLAVSLLGLVGAPLLSALTTHVEAIGFTPTGFSLGVFAVFLGLVCLQLSISLSGLHGAVQDLAEHAALVEQRVRALEAGRAREEAPDAEAIGRSLA